MTQQKTELGFSTRSIMAGEQPVRSYKPIVGDLVLSTSFKSEYDMSFSIEGQQEGEAAFFYTRWGNPTIRRLEEKLANLEGAAGCVAFASGMAAVTALLLHELKAGDHVIISDICYAAVSEVTNDLFPGLNIEVTKVNLSNIQELSMALTSRTKLIYVETPSNPLLRLTDLEQVIEQAKTVDAKVAVDSTFATPMGTRPLEWGVDYVIHSLTKYLNGHGDAMGGALLGKKEVMEEIRKKVLIKTGGVISPFNAWIIMRGMATFPLRMKAHEEHAMHVASFLEKHPSVTKVIYPGLPSHPQFELAQKQMDNYSGMLTFQVEVGDRASRLMAEELEIVQYAVSLGHHHSLIYYLPTKDLLKTTFKLNSEQEESYRAYAGDGIFRMSVGLEDAEDICRDLSHILDQL